MAMVQMTRPKPFGKRLKQARLERGLTLEGIAHQIGTDFSTIWRYEADQRTPSGPTLYALAQAYGHPVEWFYSSEDDPEEAPEPDPEEDAQYQADLDLVMGEVTLALRDLNRPLTPEDIKGIAAFIRATRELERQREQGDSGQG